VMCCVGVGDCVLLSAMDGLAAEKLVLVLDLGLGFCLVDVDDGLVLVLVVDRFLAVVAEVVFAPFAGNFYLAVSPVLCGTRQVYSYVHAKTREAPLSVLVGPV
jgi:hypothetical protein